MSWIIAQLQFPLFCMRSNWCTGWPQVSVVTLGPVSQRDPEVPTPFQLDLRAAANTNGGLQTLSALDSTNSEASRRISWFCCVCLKGALKPASTSSESRTAPWHPGAFQNWEGWELGVKYFRIMPHNLQGQLHLILLICCVIYGSRWAWMAELSAVCLCSWMWSETS